MVLDEDKGSSSGSGIISAVVSVEIRGKRRKHGGDEDQVRAGGR